MFVALLAVLITMSAFAQAPGPSSPSQPPPSYRFLSGDSTPNIPVELVANGLVFVQAKVNDHPGWFILDNASQGFLVDREYARQMSLQTSGSAVSRNDVSDAVEVGIIRDVQISLAGMDLTHRNLVVIDLKSLEPSIGHTVDGIIGSRLFDDFVVAVDYERRLLSIYLPGKYQPSPKETALPVRLDEHGFQFIDATIALPGVEPIAANFLIDGGANSYVDLYKPFSDAHHLPPTAMKLLDDPGSTAGGATQSRDGRANRLTVGTFSIENPPVTFSQGTEGLMAAKDHAGLVGAEFLERFTVVFDNRSKRLLLTPNRSFANPANYDRSGLRIHAEGAAFRKFVVGRILPRSPAAEAGVEPGDVIESIDNHSTEEMTLTEVRNMFCQPKETLALNVLRGNKNLQVVLRLRPLI
ncbi:MAG TPA: aspartyl protease family protein [Candidatus Acidoferrales bacterium]|nr:aspartyl protease family protein [Candidatus Acidoferrales bacterium]